MKPQSRRSILLVLTSFLTVLLVPFRRLFGLDGSFNFRSTVPNFRSPFYPTQLPAETLTQTIEVFKPLFQSNSEYEEPDPTPRLIGLSPRFCIACGSAKKALAGVPIDWQDKQMSGCPQYPAVYDPVMMKFYYGHHLASPDALARAVSANQPQSFKRPTRLSLGSVDFSLAYLRQWIGQSGSLSRSGKWQLPSTPWFTIRIPENFRLEWATQPNPNRANPSSPPKAPEDFQTVIKFLTKPVVRIKIVDQSISGIVITNDSIRLNIDWFPDITIPQKGYESTVLARPDIVSTRWSYPGNDYSWKSSDEITRHLQYAHGSQFDISKMDDLTHDEKLALHSDCHTSRVKQFVQLTFDPDPYV